MTGRLDCIGKCAFFALILLLAGSTWAEENEGAPTGPPFPMRPFFVQVRYMPSVIMRTDFARADGSMAATRQDLTGTLIIPIPQQQGRLLLSGSHNWMEYRFSGNEILAGRLEDARDMVFSAVYMGNLPGDWSLFAMGNVQTAAERGASMWNDRAMGGSAQAQYEMGENLQVGLGFMAMDHWEEGMRVFPMVSIDWRATERLRLRTTRGLNVGYALDERGHWTLGWNTEFFSRYIRLNESGEGGGGVFRSRAIVSALSLLYRPNPGVTVGAEVGTSLWRTLRIRDPEGETIFRSRTDPGATAAFTVSWTF